MFTDHKSCMMKFLTLVLIQALPLVGFSQDVKFEVKFSEPLAVFEFIKSLSPTAPDNSYKKLFTQSSFNSKKYTDLLAQADSLHLEYGYEFNEYPIDQKVGGYSESLLKRNLILSTDVHDFKLRSLGIVPFANLIRLCYLMEEFTPVYRQVIYEPGKMHFEGQLAGFSELLNKTNMQFYFSQALHFYNSAWDRSIPFIFCFYPLPNSKRFSATAISNVSISAVPDTLDGYGGLLSVMLHEISHILYDEKSLQLWKDIDRWFNSSPSKSSRYAYSLFNEAMATSVANGYLATQLNGKENPGGWYGVKYISLMAKQAYPMVKEYITGKRSMDEEFIRRYIQLFDDNFSGWLTDMDYLMRGRYVLSQNPADFSHINRTYRTGGEQKTEISLQSIREMKKHPTTKVIIVNSDNKGLLKLIKDNFDELQAWKPNPQADFTYTAFLHDKTYLIILNNVKGTSEEKLKTIVVR